jgi:hypothetical protein
VNLLQIQGKYADKWWLHDKEQHFISLIESLTDQPILFISTVNRTDLFFFDISMLDNLIKTWCLSKCRDYYSRYIELFTVKQGRNESLRHYFTSLYSLAIDKKAYQEYREKFNKIKNKYGDNKIMDYLISSERYLERINKAYRSSGMILNNNQDSFQLDNASSGQDDLQWIKNMGMN